MKNALIGFTGFVGSTLLKQKNFDSLYRSSNINEIRGNSFDCVVCAGAPAQKWLANKDPENDFKIISELIENLKTLSCNTFILISTVDVFKIPQAVDESSDVDEEGLHAYGLHRRYLEKFVIENFSKHLIVRLPGLVGPGLKKNIIFDLLNGNNLHMIESKNIFQFYPMVNLWNDIEIALAKNLKLIHLTSEPISVAELAQEGFGSRFDQGLLSSPVIYNMMTQYANIFGGIGCYQYSKRETLLAVRAYRQSEPLTRLVK